MTLFSVQYTHTTTTTHTLIHSYLFSLLPLYNHTIIHGVPVSSSTTLVLTPFLLGSFLSFPFGVNVVVVSRTYHSSVKTQLYFNIDIPSFLFSKRGGESF